MVTRETILREAAIDYRVRRCYLDENTGPVASRAREVARRARAAVVRRRPELPRARTR
jgi:hypothetical protein